MTAPVAATTAAKAWMGSLVTLLTAQIPWILETIVPMLPAPWPTVIASLMTVLAWLGIYRIPNKPKSGVVVTNPNVDPPATSGKPYPNDSWK